jgi:zinc protease
MELANKHLSQIPWVGAPSDFTQSVSQMFPPGVTKVDVKMPRRFDTVTRITFPWKKTMSERKIYKMAITCQIVKARLKRVITEKMKHSYGIDVAYEFPFYPFLDNPWISIRFRSDADHLEQINKLILSELKKLQEYGIDESELAEIKKLEAGRDEFRLSDNFYWVSMLANYYLWDWDPQWIHRSSMLTQEISVDKVNWILKTAFSLENYSVVTAKP